jgi:hypothetical protein
MTGGSVGTPVLVASIDKTRNAENNEITVGNRRWVLNIRNRQD